MTLVQNFNVSPYYDDYDEDKKFIRMLFRPGYAVQARELTQLQTLLQKQIDRFGSHIFRNGSVVTGGEVSFSTTVSYLKLQTTDSNGNNIDVANFLNKKLKKTSEATGAVATVVAAIEATETDPPTLIIQYNAPPLLSANTTFFTLEDSPFEARVLNEAGAAGPSSVASINEGVYFIDGIFVKVNQQTIPLEKYSMFATYRIGLAVEESVVTETTDTSLLDPALNASNYQAPGAARYKINLKLEKRSLTSIDDTKFFEILRLENSKIVLHRRYPIYSELEKTLARRTFDESGNYTVKPFLISVTNHIPPIGNTANTQLLTASLSPGKAYVYGFERETVGTTLIDLKKARTKANVSNYDIETNYGNYLEVSNVKGLFDISTMSSMDLHCVPVDKVNTANTNLISSTKIGTARIRQIEFVSAANTGNATTYKNNFYIFDTNFLPVTGNANGGNTTSIILANNGIASTTSNAYSGAIIRITTGLAGDNVKRTITNYDHLTKTATVDSNNPFIISPGANSVYSIDFGIKDLESFVINSSTTLIATANVSDTNKTGTIATGNTFLSDTNFNSLVFKIPENYISFNMTDQDYRGRRVFKNQTVTAGVLNLSTGSGTEVFVGSGALSDTQKLEHFLVYANNVAGAPEFTANQAISFATSTGRSVTVSGSTANLSFATGNTFTVDIISTVDFNSPSAKLKSYVSANTTHAVTTGGTTIGNTVVYLASGQVAISTPNRRNGDSDNLYIADIHQLDGNFEKNYGSFNIKTRGITRKSSFKVIDSGNTAAAVVTADLTNTTKDITDRYVLNTGQKDGYYDHGSITLKPYANPPTGQILVLVNYFTHSGSSGYLTCDSYNVASLSANTDTRYALIPSFTSPTTGEVLNLRDCVDFRPIRTNAITDFTLNGISLTEAEGALESDYSYYLPRQDKIVLTQEGKFQILEGISDLNPRSPAEAENGMTLYKILLLPFTFFPTDIRSTYVENKRYTMRDIGRLEKRIENVEYYTTLNTLEKSAQDLTILDANGLERFKNGIVVDSFRGHKVGDVRNIDYTCSMNYETGELRPYFSSNSISFVVDSASTTANSYIANTVITMPYTSSAFITQNVATNSLAVNPFNLTFYSGTIDLFPASDVWIDTETRPDVLVNLEGENDNWEAITAANADPRNFGFGTQWGDWNTYVTGQSVEETRRTEQSVRGDVRYQDTISRTVTTTNYGKSRHGTTQIIVPERIQQSIGKRQVDLSIIPFIREKPILFGAKNLKPNRFAFTFFDDIPVNRFIEIPTIIETTNVSVASFKTLETVTSTSGGTGRVLVHTGRSYGANNSYLHIAEVKGTIAANDTITGAESGATAFVNSCMWNNGNVVTANTDTITLGSGAPYTSWYTDIGNTSNSIDWANPRDWYSHPARANTAKNYSVAYGYNQIRILSGTGAGQVRYITSYNGSTKIATLDIQWNVIPDQTSRWSVQYPSTDDFGIFVGTFYLPNLNASSYLDEFKFKVGSKIFKVTDNSQNDPLFATMGATAAYHAQGILNTIEDVSVSVRVPTIATSTVFEEASAGSTYAVNDSTVESRVIGYIYSPPPSPPPPSDGSYVYIPPPPDPPPSVVPVPVSPYPSPAPTPTPPPALPPTPEVIPPPVITVEPVAPPPEPISYGDGATANDTGCTSTGTCDAGGGGGGKIICTKLYQLGLLAEEIYLADQAFGAKLVKTNPDIYNGYRAWAEIVVDWMKGNGPNMMPWLSEKRRREILQNWSTSWAKEIATPWAEEMAYKMGVKESGNITGKLITAAGIPICKVVGVWQRIFGSSKKPAGFGKGALLIPVFILFKLIVKFGRLIEDKKTPSLQRT